MEERRRYSGKTKTEPPGQARSEVYGVIQEGRALASRHLSAKSG
jgi:hypothetical protein